MRVSDRWGNIPPTKVWIIQDVKCSYSPHGKASENKQETVDEQGKKQVKLSFRVFTIS